MGRLDRQKSAVAIALLLALVVLLFAMLLMRLLGGHWMAITGVAPARKVDALARELFQQALKLYEKS